MIKVEKKTGIFEPQNIVCRVRQRFGIVLLFINESVIEFKTPAAFKLGFEVVKKAGELLNNEYISVTINGSEIRLLYEQAHRLGGALLRKCDDADDYQLRRKA